MKQKLQLIVGIVLALLVVGCTTSQPVASEDTFRIGVIAPLTGDAAPWGIPPKEGVELAVAQFGKNVQVFNEDSECDAKKAVSAAQKLITVHDVDVIVGAVCSSSTLAIAPIVEEAGVVLVSPASTSPLVSDAGDYVFRVAPSDTLRGEVFAEYVYDEGHEKVGLLYLNNEGAKGGRDSFVNSFLGEVVAEEAYDKSVSDLKTELTKVMQEDPEALVVISYQADTVLALKQAKELGIDIPLYFQTEALDDPAVQEAAGSSAIGATYILPEEAYGSKVNQFQEDFEAYFSKEPSLFAAEGYDAAKLLMTLDEMCDNRGCIKEKLYDVQGYEGASGEISFDENGDVDKPMEIKVVD